MKKYSILVLAILLVYGFMYAMGEYYMYSNPDDSNAFLLGGL